MIPPNIKKLDWWLLLPRREYRKYFWNKKWYQKWILNRWNFFAGNSILLPGGGWDRPKERR